MLAKYLFLILRTERYIPFQRWNNKSLEVTIENKSEELAMRMRSLAIEAFLSVLTKFV